MRKQVITITLKLKPGQKPYHPVENKLGGKPYEALKHFFEDIEYKVDEITISRMIYEMTLR